MSMRTLSTQVLAGKNSNVVFPNWHTHESKGGMHKGIIAVSNGLTTRVAQRVIRIPHAEFNKAAYPADAVIEPGAREVRVVEGLRSAPAFTLTHFGDALEHDGSPNNTGDAFDRRFMRCFYTVNGLPAALKAHPEIGDILEADQPQQNALVFKAPL